MRRTKAPRGRSLSPTRARITSSSTGTSSASRPRPAPLDQDGLIALFDGSETGAGIELVPATDTDMRGKNAKPRESLEVVYDDV